MMPPHSRGFGGYLTALTMAIAACSSAQRVDNENRPVSARSVLVVADSVCRIDDIGVDCRFIDAAEVHVRLEPSPVTQLQADARQLCKLDAAGGAYCYTFVCRDPLLSRYVCADSTPVPSGTSVTIRGTVVPLPSGTNAFSSYHSSPPFCASTQRGVICARGTQPMSRGEVFVNAEESFRTLGVVEWIRSGVGVCAGVGPYVRCDGGIRFTDDDPPYAEPRDWKLSYTPRWVSLQGELLGLCTGDGMGTSDCWGLIPAIPGESDRLAINDVREPRRLTKPRKYVALENQYACAIDMLGGVDCAGVGPIAGGPMVSTPRMEVSIRLPRAAVSLDVGFHRGCALTEDGRVWCWRSGEDIVREVPF